MQLSPERTQYLLELVKRQHDELPRIAQAIRTASVNVNRASVESLERRALANRELANTLCDEAHRLMTEG